MNDDFTTIEVADTSSPDLCVGRRSATSSVESVDQGERLTRPSRAERVGAHRADWAATYAATDPAERWRLCRPAILRERALAATAGRADLDARRTGGAASLLAAYLGARRLERCLAERRAAPGARWPRPLVVGLAPNGRDQPLDEPSGRRVASLLGLRDEAELRARCEVVNLLGDGEVASAALLRERAGALYVRRRVVLLLGRAVAGAFGIGREPALHWAHVRPRGPALLVVPHPSGRCRWWSDAGNRAVAASVLGELARDLWADETDEIDEIEDERENEREDECRECREREDERDARRSG
jgi:hypothetical protein